MSNKTRVLRRPTPLVPILDVSVGEVLYRSISTHTKNHPALINGHTGESITYPELLEKTCSLAEALRKAGYGPNTNIAVSSKNDIQFFVPVIAAFYIGAPVAPINHGYMPAELHHVLNVTKPKIVFCAKDVVDRYSKLREKMTFIEKLIVIDSEESTTEAESMKHFVGRYVKSPVSKITTTPVDAKEHTALILCSSGTTGLPKGVMVTHRNMYTAFSNLMDPRYHLQNPINLLVVPFFHSSGLFFALSGIMMNALSVFLHAFKPDDFLKSIQDYKVNRLFLVPPLVVFLAKSPMVLNYDLSSVEDVICGSAPLRKSTEEEFKKRVNWKQFRQGYGLTESTFGCMLMELNDPYKPGSAGKIIPYMSVAFRDLETGEFLGPNKSGEICLKGPLIMKGYCDNPKATKDSFTEDGWLLTGDYGYYDEEEYIYVMDRLKELIKYKGFQVAPAELEALLLTHPEIVESGVVGVPDELAGELPMAFVVKSEGSKLTEKDVQDFVKSKLSSQKWLRGGVKFLNAIPKNPSGKVLRKELRVLMEKYKSKL